MPVMLYLRGISVKGLKHVMDFVYKGSISLPQEDLNDFLAVGESLQIPLLERSKPISAKRKTNKEHWSTKKEADWNSPAKRAHVPNMKKKKMRARMVQQKVLPKDDG